MAAAAGSAEEGLLLASMPRPSPDPVAEAIARFRGLPGVRAGSGKKPLLPKPLTKIGKGEKTLAEIVSEQR